MVRTGVITGITGQDGSYLAEILLDKGYKVVGISRRRSNGGADNIQHLLDREGFNLVWGDITDSGSLFSIIEKWQPDEFYNLAAQSFVGLSWKEPYHTSRVTALGALNCLEAIRHVKKDTRYYQASSSEMFGKVVEMPQRETTPFHPRSPYGVSKVYAYWITRNYRESYGMHTSNGILFNHECFFYKTPVILMKNGEINITYVGDLIQNRSDCSKDTPTLTKDYVDSGLKIWDGCNFVNLKAVSRKKLNALDIDNRTKMLSVSRCGAVETTPNHKLIDIDGKKREAKHCAINETELKPAVWPPHFSNKGMTPQFAALLGLLCGDGHVSKEGKIRLSNNDVKIREWFSGCASYIEPNTSYRDYTEKSGFGGTSTYRQLTGFSTTLGKYIREQIYHHRTGCKKVPQSILNTTLECKRSFLEGYNASDGLKSNGCTYLFRNFKTNSPLLAQGLLYLVQCVTQQTFNICPEERDGRIYYSVNLHTDNVTNIGKHLKKNISVLKKQIVIPQDNQHVFDIETETGTVMAGVGAIYVGNSPRRGMEFVTRKITDGAARIKLQLGDTLALGNLDAKRDWGHAKDYMQAAWLMLQQDEPDDYVVATGKSHSIRDLLDAAFGYVGLDWTEYVTQDPRFMRPAEVDILLGDSSKAREQLGWTPEYDFTALIEEMVEEDLKRYA